MALSILGFLVLAPSNQPYTVVAQADDQYAVKNPNGTWVSVQPNGVIASRPADWPLGGYELATFLDGKGLLYQPVPGAAYLLPAVTV